MLTGGRCSEVDLVLKMLGRDLEWSLLTGGRYSEVVVNTCLTVVVSYFCNFQKQSDLCVPTTLGTWKSGCCSEGVRFDCIFSNFRLFYKRLN